MDTSLEKEQEKTLHSTMSVVRKFSRMHKIPMYEDRENRSATMYLYKKYIPKSLWGVLSPSVHLHYLFASGKESSTLVSILTYSIGSFGGEMASLSDFDLEEALRGICVEVERKVPDLCEEYISNLEYRAHLREVEAKQQRLLVSKAKKALLDIDSKRVCDEKTI